MAQAAVGLAVLALLAGAESALAGEREGGAGGRPRIDLRATPRLALPPASVFVVAEIKGRAGEDFYCPGLEWEWGDGSRSAEEGDCPPYEDGGEVTRFYSARHAYGTPGSYGLKLTLRRAERTLAVASMRIVVVGGSAP